MLWFDRFDEGIEVFNEGGVRAEEGPEEVDGPEEEFDGLEVNVCWEVDVVWVGFLSTVELFWLEVLLEDGDALVCCCVVFWAGVRDEVLVCLFVEAVLGIRPNCFYRLLKSKKSKVAEAWLKVWLLVLRWLAETIGIGPCKAIWPFEAELVLLELDVPAEFCEVFCWVELLLDWEVTLAVAMVAGLMPNRCSSELKSINPLVSMLVPWVLLFVLVMLAWVWTGVVLLPCGVWIFYCWVAALLVVTELFLAICYCICLRSLCVIFNDWSSYVMLILLNAVFVPLGTTCPLTISRR